MANLNLFSIVAYIVIVGIVITIHEFSHAWAGHALGDVTAKREGRLTLNPLAHIDPFLTLLLPIILILVGSPIVFGAAKPVPFNPYAVKYGKFGAAMVAFAGPLSNFLMAAFVGVYLRFFSLGTAANSILVGFVLINLGFFVFNMIPIPPLDGSRLLYAIAPDGLADLMDRFETTGLIGVFFVFFLFFSFLQPVLSGIINALATLLLGRGVL